MYINVKKEHDRIIKKYKEALAMISQGPEDEGLKFFSVLNYLACDLTALRKRSYSVTDCCTTVESLEELFQPQYIEEEMEITTAKEFLSLLDGKNNTFLLITVMPTNMPFHTFVLIKYKDNYYLLQSFHNICQMTVILDSTLPIYIADFIENPNEEKYNHLFGAQLDTTLANLSKQNISNQNIKTNMTVSYAYFEELPLDKLERRLLNFIKY